MKTPKEQLQDFLGIKLVGDVLSAQNVVRIIDAIKWRDKGEHITPQEEENFYKKIFSNKDTYNACLHDSCQTCHGTGIRNDGLGSCIHAMSCPCHKHSVIC